MVDGTRLHGSLGKGQAPSRRARFTPRWACPTEGVAVAHSAPRDPEQGPPQRALTSHIWPHPPSFQLLQGFLCCSHVQVLRPECGIRSHNLPPASTLSGSSAGSSQPSRFQDRTLASAGFLLDSLALGRPGSIHFNLCVQREGEVKAHFCPSGCPVSPARWIESLPFAH